MAETGPEIPNNQPELNRNQKNLREKTADFFKRNPIVAPFLAISIPSTSVTLVTGQPILGIITVVVEAAGAVAWYTHKEKKEDELYAQEEAMDLQRAEQSKADLKQ